ncbi:MAG: hypothetical protein RL722_1240 [Pseudomonadota bacterium]|jgi:uncharacterized protein YegP (UPF0339 family)
MFEILRAERGGYYWRLKALNGETLCHSEVYTTKQAALGGIEAMKRVAPNAPVHDRTLAGN